MQVSELVKRVIGHRAKRQAEAVADYQELVSAMAAGKDIDAEDAANAMDAAEKTEADLARDVELVHRRRALAEKLRKLPELRAAIADVDAKLLNEEGKLDMARAAHRAACEPLTATRSQLEAQLSIADSAAGELFVNCRNPKIEEQERRLVAEAKELEAELRAITDRFSVHSKTEGAPGPALATAHREVQKCKEAINGLIGERLAERTAALKRAEQQLEAIERNAEPLRARQVALTKRRAEVAQEQHACDLAKLQP